VLLMRKHAFQAAGWNSVLELINTQEGMHLLEQGVQVFNTHLGRNVTFFATFGSWLADSPDRNGVASFKNYSGKSIKGCPTCLSDSNTWVTRLFGNDRSVSDPQRFQTSVNLLPATGTKLTSSELLVASELNVK
jgi:hypothetical protein